MRDYLQPCAAVLVMIACRSAAPVSRSQLGANSAPPQHQLEATLDSDEKLTPDEANARCRQKLSGCRRPFAAVLSVSSLPMSACANQGTRCVEHEQASKYDERYSVDSYWKCGCDDCASHDECNASEYCGVVDSCPGRVERKPLQCLEGPRVAAVSPVMLCPAVP